MSDTLFTFHSECSLIITRNVRDNNTYGEAEPAEARVPAESRVPGESRLPAGSTVPFDSRLPAVSREPAEAKHAELHLAGEAALLSDLTGELTADLLWQEREYMTHYTHFIVSVV